MQTLGTRTDTIRIWIHSISKLEQNILKHRFERKLALLRESLENKISLDSACSVIQDRPGNIKPLDGTKNALYLNYNFRIIGLPVATRKLTLLKSPHVHKKAKQHFIKTKYTTLFIVKTTDSSSNAVEFQLRNLIAEFARNLPKTVEIVMDWRKNTK